jgi:asparagine synthase (glutamine-hydrolysing)
MCGITGILNLNRNSVSISTLKKMTDIIRHRGPDGEGIWTDKYIGFGHRRLSIIDLSPLGNQPMQSEDGNFIITYNGEIYNFQNIKIELESLGYKFYSRTDSEVVLKSFMHWGKDCVFKFNGMFAFAVWNIEKDNLFLARDRYGIKPLYYYFKNDLFLFASEIKSILQHPSYTADVSINALNEYFSFQNIFSDLTLFKDIKLLPPGSYININLKNKDFFKQEKYWDFNFYDDEMGDEKALVCELEKLFEQAVNRQLISDVEIGSYLSGGMDSGSVTSIAAKNFRNLKTFTAGFDLSSASGLELGFDEREKAEFLSNIYKTEHYEIVLKAGDMERIMKELVWHLEDLRVGQSYPNYYVARLASKFVKVVLSGAGGDELFAGYPWRYYTALVNDNYEHYIDKYYRYWQRLISDSEKQKFYQPSIYPEILNYQTKDVFKSIMNSNKTEINSLEDYINRSLYFEIKTFLHGLLVVEDKLSMAHSLETRVPLLDNDLVDFAMKVPVKFKLKNFKNIKQIDEDDTGKFSVQSDESKMILRSALKNYIPDVFTKAKKQGFSAPDASWFKGESIEYIKNLLLDKRARIYDYFQHDFVSSKLNEHFEGKENRRLLIWSLLNFEWWCKIFIN